MNWPQIVVIVLFAVAFVVSALQHGQTSKISMWVTSFRVALWATVLHFGGFW